VNFTVNCLVCLGCLGCLDCLGCLNCCLGCCGFVVVFFCWLKFWGLVVSIFAFMQRCEVLKCKEGRKRAVDSVRWTVVEIRSLKIGSMLSEALLLLLLPDRWFFGTAEDFSVFRRPNHSGWSAISDALFARLVPLPPPRAGTLVHGAVCVLCTDRILLVDGLIG
jgi:hypothetical protein